MASVPADQQPGNYNHQVNSPSFANFTLTEGALPGFTPDGSSSNSSSANYSVTITPEVISRTPEPGTLALCSGLLSTVGIGLLRRRRTRTNNAS